MPQEESELKSVAEEFDLTNSNGGDTSFGDYKSELTTDQTASQLARYSSSTYQWPSDKLENVSSLWLGNFQTERFAFLVVVSEDVIRHFPQLRNVRYSEPLGSKYIYVPGNGAVELKLGPHNTECESSMLEFQVIRWRASNTLFPERLFLMGRKDLLWDAKYVEFVPSIRK